MRGLRARPRDLDDAEMIEALVDGWDICPESSAYLPEGGGSHHWKVTDSVGGAYFVTVDDLDERDWLGSTRDDVFEGASRALETASALRGRAGLHFVVAPLSATDGGVVKRLGPRYALSVYPFLAGMSFSFGAYPSPALRSAALDMVAALHRATAAVADIAPPREVAVGHREDLDAFLLPAPLVPRRHRQRRSALPPRS